MKRLTFAAIAILMAFTAVTALAADVTGNWTGQMVVGPNGDPFPVSFAFKQDGTKLTGTVQGPEGEPVAISDGKVDGDKLSFTVVVHEEMKIKHEGSVSGDEIKLTSKADGDFPGGEMKLKRAR